jgi:hypothetical protein
MCSLNLLPLAVELWVFMIAFVIFDDRHIGWSISLPDALLVHKCFREALHFGVRYFFKIIAVSIGGFLMPTAGFSVSPCGQVGIGVLIVLKLATK